MSEQWEEAEHPRDDSGKFAPKGGGESDTPDAGREPVADGERVHPDRVAKWKSELFVDRGIDPEIIELIGEHYTPSREVPVNKDGHLVNHVAISHDGVFLKMDEWGDAGQPPASWITKLQAAGWSFVRSEVMGDGSNGITVYTGKDADHSLLQDAINARLAASKIGEGSKPTTIKVYMRSGTGGSIDVIDGEPAGGTLVSDSIEVSAGTVLGGRWKFMIEAMTTTAQLNTTIAKIAIGKAAKQYDDLKVSDPEIADLKSRLDMAGAEKASSYFTQRQQMALRQWDEIQAVEPRWPDDLIEKMKAAHAAGNEEEADRIKAEVLAVAAKRKIATKPTSDRHAAEMEAFEKEIEKSQTVDDPAKLAGLAKATSMVAPKDAATMRAAEEWLQARMPASVWGDALKKLEVTAVPTKSDRASCHYVRSATGNIAATIRIPWKDELPLSTAIHEYGHALESVPEVARACQVFLMSRVGRDASVPLAGIGLTGRKYDADEVGRSDSFTKALDGGSAFYAGKYYEDGSTEVLSMGLARLHQNATSFAKDDPEYYAFVTGILSGKLWSKKDTKAVDIATLKAFSGQLWQEYKRLTASGPSSPASRATLKRLSECKRVIAELEGKPKLAAKWDKAADEWDEEKHPRDESGKFAPKGSADEAGSGEQSDTPAAGRGNMPADAGKHGFRIVSVDDTRDYIEDGDRFIPVPGSGVSNTCDRCGREHEVHYQVEDNDSKKVYTVGGSCAVATGVVDVKENRSIVGAEKRRAAIEAEIRIRNERIAKYDAAKREVDAMEFPPVEREPDTQSNRTIWKMGDAQVWDFTNAETLSAERLSTLRDAWRDKRIREKTDITGTKRAIDGSIVKQLHRDLEKIDAKLEKMLSEKTESDTAMAGRAPIGLPKGQKLGPETIAVCDEIVKAWEPTPGNLTETAVDALYEEFTKDDENIDAVRGEIERFAAGCLEHPEEMNVAARFSESSDEPETAVEEAFLRDGMIAMGGLPGTPKPAVDNGQRDGWVMRAVDSVTSIATIKGAIENMTGEPSGLIVPEDAIRIVPAGDTSKIKLGEPEVYYADIAGKYGIAISDVTAEEMPRVFIDVKKIKIAPGFDRKNLPSGWLDAEPGGLTSKAGFILDRLSTVMRFTIRTKQEETLRQLAQGLYKPDRWEPGAEQSLAALNRRVAASAADLMIEEHGGRRMPATIQAKVIKALGGINREYLEKISPIRRDTYDRIDSAKYELLGALARTIQSKRMQSLLLDRGVLKSDDAAIDKIADDVAKGLWEGWKFNSSMGAGAALQAACTAEFGVPNRLNESQAADARRWFIMYGAQAMNGIHGLPLSYPDAQNNAEVTARWESMLGKDVIAQYEQTGRDILRCHVRATWEASQYVLQQAGIKKLTTWRAVMLPSSETKDDYDARKTVEAPGYGIAHDKYYLLPTMTLKKNGAMSTTTKPEVANEWEGIRPLPPSPVRIVMRIDTPAENMLSLPVFGQNIQDEEEIVVLGGEQNKVECYFRTAPAETFQNEEARRAKAA